MRVCGIIAEYNPFHNGHLYQLAHVREELKADYIVVAMSGNYVQRGEPALMEKHARARMALLSGADLVLELPVSTSTASAEGFASGGVQLLSSLGVVNMLCFGAETDDLPLLTAAASVLFDEPDDFRTVLREKLSEGRSFAEARAEALRHVMPGEDRLSGILASPNNILALEYLKAIRRYGRGIEPCLLVRSGSAYGSESLEAGLYPSATAIRRRIREGLEAGITADELMLSLAPHMPEDALRVLDEAVRTGGIFPSTGLDEALRYRLFMEEPGTLVRYLDVDEPLARRIGHLRYQYQGAAAFAKLLKTRNMALSHVQRALLHILLGIGSLPSGMPYARVLGFRETARVLFAQLKEKAPEALLVTKLSDAVDVLDERGRDLLFETVRASELYEAVLAGHAGRTAVREFSRPMEIIRS